MTARFDTAPAPDVLFRVARKPEVWAWTDLKYSGQGRWDDPHRSYHVVYASTTAFGAYLEKLAEFRPDLELVAEFANIRSNDRGAPRTVMAGTLPVGWRARHLVGKGVTDGVSAPLVAVGKAQSLATLRTALAPLARELGIPEIEDGVIRLDFSAEFRRFTQAIARFIFEQRSRGGARYGGIFYLSQYADDVTNCALFECNGFPVTNLERREIDFDDEDFLRACELHQLRPS